MALFGSGETKEEKQARKTTEILRKYGVEELSDPRDVAAVKMIADELVGCKLVETGLFLQGNTADAQKLAYLRVLMEQNFIIIRQLDRLNKK
jgi:hypothetical protein